jgi:tRNA G18 (ribose-2'-O)-methylase SpoU
MEAARRQIAGAHAISAALTMGEPIQVLLVDRGDASDETTQLVARAEAAGVGIWRGSAADLMRMSRGNIPDRVIAMLGPKPRAELEELCMRGGAIWLLHRASYPSNVGFAIRTAEVSGAQGVVVDARFNHDERSRIAHVSMGAHRMLPVLFADSAQAVAVARRHGHRIVAIEDSGEQAPWDIDLTGPLLLIVGNERDGIDADLLLACDAVTALPMAGFVPSYNLHAAMAAVASERLRQLRIAAAPRALR